MSNNEQTIKCNVSTCKYNDCHCNLCNLDEIKIGCDCNNEDCSCKEETICCSYKKK